MVGMSRGLPKSAVPPVTGHGALESEVLARIRSALERDAAAPVGEIWIGDDAAVVGVPGRGVVLATDTAVAGVHADLGLVGLDDLGWKALTAAVSDVAAMGAWCRHALVALCAPPGTDIDRLNDGLAQAAAHWHCPVVGGDLSTAGQVVVAVTVTGSLGEGPGPVTRAGAAPGDHLVLTGPLGGSAAGLRLLRQGREEPSGSAGFTTAGEGPDPDRADDLVSAHRRPRARLAEGWTARLAGATAMIDISDGLSIDLARLAAASGVGARLEEVPVAEGATLDEALGGGEDYELLIAVPDVGVLTEAFAAAGLRPPLLVGRCTAGPAEVNLGGRRLAAAGWEHQF